MAAGATVEPHGWGGDGSPTSPLYADQPHGNWAPSAASPLVGTGAPLAADIAAAVGVAGGVPVNRGALLVPGGTQKAPRVF